MQSSQIPAKFAIPFANNAGPGYIETIPQASQRGITPGRASLFDGFPPENFIAAGAGGTPTLGQDWNGLHFQETSWLQWAQAGGAVKYDAGFSAAIGGYPKGACIAAATLNQFWISQVENNVTDPDTGGAGWAAFPPIGTTPVVSFNGRNGTVILLSADVVSALATNALANVKLAQMGANTVKMNVTGSAATPQDVSTINLWGNGNLFQAPALTVKSNLSGSTANVADNSLAAFAAALGIGTGLLASPGFFQIPMLISGVMRLGMVQWGQLNTSISQGTYAFTFPDAFPGACLGGLAVPINASNTSNHGIFMELSTSPAPSKTSITFVAQWDGEGGKNVADGIQYWAWGF